MAVLFQIILHTPPWVWGLLALVLWLGWRDLRDRTVVPAQLAILPAVAASMSLVGVVTSTTPATALAAWLPAMAVAAPLGALIAAGRRLEVRPKPPRLTLGGSWFAMALGLAIFCIRYAMGVAVALDPSLAVDTLWIVAANAVGGAVAGIGLGWLACLVRRCRDARHTDTEEPVTARTINAL